MRQMKYLAISVLVIALIAGGWFFWQKPNNSTDRQGSGAVVNEKGVVQDDSGKEVQYWYDPMVPNQKFDKPGKSPFMDMQLVPKYAGEGGDESAVSIPSSTVQNLGIRTEKVSEASFGTSISAVGRIEPDERRYYSVQTRVPGFVERLHVRAEGDPVSKNQKLAEVYAPELLGAQEEYLALLGLKQVDEKGELAKAARNRLKLLGMTSSEIDQITRTGQAKTRIGIYAPASGIVTALGVREGAELMSGEQLMQIADLSNVWLITEVPERDAGFIEPGTDAVVELQSRPGVTLEGDVSYVYPTLDETARTLRLRVELPNPKGILRPGMYANVQLGLEKREALAVPSESIIATGTRKVVIVKNEKGFQPVEVVTGREADGKTEIIKGLNEGEAVVSSGQFLIDSEASLSGVLARLAAQESRTMEIPGTEMGTSRQDPKPQVLSSSGKVIEIDLANGKVTLAHEPIPAIGWPSMTMGFAVNDLSQLQNLKPGDSVSFDLKEAEEEGLYIIDQIQKQSSVQRGVPE